MGFQVHTLESAPAGSRETMAKIAEKYGFVPNLAAVFAESPGTLNALLGLLGAYDAEEIGLSPLERQVVLLATSVQNECEYCTAGHSMLAGMCGLDRGEVENLQEGRRLGDPRLEVLRQFTEAVVEKRGHASEDDIRKFLGVGFTRAQVLEVVLGVALKTLTNYVNHIAKPPVNEQFHAYLPEWAK